MDITRWKLTGTSSDHLTSLSVNQNVQSDCTLTASFRKPTAGFGILPKIGDKVSYKVLLYKYMYETDALDPFLSVSLIEGIVDSRNIDADTYQITAKTDFNNFVKSGKLKELDFMSPEELKALFDIEGTPTKTQQREFFDAASKFNGAVYYGNTTDVDDIVRKVVQDVIEDGPIIPPVPIKFLVSTGSISEKRDDGGQDSTPNVYDIVYNVRFTRIDTLVKDISIAEDDARPSGLRQIVDIPVGDGDTYEAYGTYDRPPKKSLILQAIQSSGWTVDSSSIDAVYRTTNIIDLDGATIIHAADASDDLVSMSLKATRRFTQNAALPIVARIYNREAIAQAGQINYKRVDKTFTYNYVGSFLGSTIISNYYDVIGNAYLDAMDAFILKAKYEMKSTGMSLLTGSYNENIILTYNLYRNEISDRLAFTALLLSAPPPWVYPSNIGDRTMIMGRSFSFDVNSGSATLNLQAKFIKELDTDAEIPPELEFPEPVVISTNSAPHDALGAGNLSVNGPEPWWTDDTKWSFENDVELSHYYSYYVPAATLQESSDPETAVTNYYCHDTYKHPKYDGVPFEATSEQSRIKYDRQKPLYTVAISLPQLTYPDIEL